MELPSVIADSSIWIDHINSRHPGLEELLRRRRVVMHPMILGEIAMGSLKSRGAVLQELRKLPQALPASHAEVMAMVEWLELFNRGIGFVDAHLLASTRTIQDGSLLTRDRRLNEQAERLGIAYQSR
jgi:predicted nucleic acid-binding protein